MRIGCIGDVHFGAGVSAYGPERLEDQYRVLCAAFDLFGEQDCDLVLVAGDTFDGPLVPPEQYMAFARALERLHVPCVVISGNGRHDLATRDMNALAVVSAMGTGVRIAVSPQVFDVAGVQVCCLPWAPVANYVAEHNGGANRDAVHQEVAELLPTIAEDLYKKTHPYRSPVILLGHWALSGTSLPSGLPTDMANEPILDTGALAAIGFDALIFGHIHKPQEFEGGFYVGSPLPLNHGEARSEHGCWIFDTTAAGLFDTPTGAEFFPLQSRPFVTVALFDPLDFPPGAIVRVKYTKTEDKAREVDTAGLRREILAAGAWRVSFEPTIVRDLQARITVDDDTDDTKAFDQWLEAEGVEDELVSTLRERHSNYIQQVPE